MVDVVDAARVAARSSLESAALSSLQDGESSAETLGSQRREAFCRRLGIRPILRLDFSRRQRRVLAPVRSTTRRSRDRRRTRAPHAALVPVFARFGDRPRRPGRRRRLSIATATACARARARLARRARGELETERKKKREREREGERAETTAHSNARTLEGRGGIERKLVVVFSWDWSRSGSGSGSRERGEGRFESSAVYSFVFSTKLCEII